MLATHYGKFEKLGEQIARLRLPVEVYRPTIDKPVDVGGQVVWIPEPLFYEYLFLSGGNAPLKELAAMAAQLPVYPRTTISGKLLTVTDDEIERVRLLASGISKDTRLHADAHDFAEAFTGRTVVITAGVFGGTYGKVVSKSGGNAVMVEIPLFDQPTRCKVKVTDVRLV